MKKAISYLKDTLAPFDARIVNLVHDEVVVECRDNNSLNEDVRIVREDMIKAGCEFIKSVPIEVDIVIDKVWRK